jgi:YHS domain-containing protein
LYTFSTLDAKESFDENPRKYIPAGEGNDVVKLTVGETGIEGTLEHAAWYRGRLYLFSSPETRREFVETPSKFVVND